MAPEQVGSLYVDMEAHGIGLWLMGGWGVDALLGRQTRAHRDLDVLVELATLQPFRRRLHDLGFVFHYVWDDETWWVRDDSSPGAEKQPTAFVYAHPDGGEIDVHVVRLEEHGSVVTLWDAPYEFTTEGLQGHGVVAGHPVRCLTVNMQRVAHSGYELPPHHAVDLQRLAELTSK